MDSLPDTHHRRHLAIMVREPRPGTVKTRLARSIGTVAAAAWYRHCCLRLIRRVDDPRWQTLLAVSPDISVRSSAVWPDHLPRLAQGAGTLGDRMGRTFRALPPGPAMIIGSDIPGITASHIKHAFQLLGNSGTVFGPSPDGGYWLVGISRLQRNSARLFRNVRWSSEHALADTIRSLPNGRVRFAATLADVDNSDDL